MIKLKELLSEMNDDLFYMYHGGKRWHYIPTDVIPSAKGRYECGVGIYLTNYYETARKYAKGSRVVHIVGIDKNFKDIKDIRIDVNEIVNGVKRAHIGQPFEVKFYNRNFRRYIQNFLTFKGDDTKKVFSSLINGAIMIVDDTIGRGNTLSEAIRVLQHGEVVPETVLCYAFLREEKN